MKVLTTFANQNWLITPVAAPVATPATTPIATEGQPQPTRIHATGIHAASIHDQLWMLVLSGVALADFKGNSGAQWLNETLSFIPDIAGPNNQGTSGPLTWAINQYHIPKPSAPAFSYDIGFSLVQWAPFASLSSIFNQNQSINSGFAVNSWHPTPFKTGHDFLSQQPINNLFTGINVDVGVRDSDAKINGIGYHITLIGKIVFTVRLVDPDPLVIVPDVVGKTAGVAAGILFFVPLEAQPNVGISPVHPDAGDWIVNSTDPEAGTSVPPHSVVRLVVSPKAL
jgi:hypothetical protein